MTIEKTPFDGLVIIRPCVFSDGRGSFFESWNEELFKKNGLDVEFVQDNQSISCQGVIRGLHFQVAPMDQGKLVRVAMGSVLDVAVDLRWNQPTFGQHFKMVLDSTDNSMLFIPPGFAHGFRSLKHHTILIYKCTKAYSKAHEKAIKWNDKDLAIDWGVTEAIVSEKDGFAPSFNEFLNNPNF